MTRLCFLLLGACWSSPPPSVAPQPIPAPPRAGPATSFPRLGHYMCQVAVDDTWDPPYACELAQYRPQSDVVTALRYDVDFTGHHVGGDSVEIHGRSVFVRGYYHLADHLREGEDYGFCITVELRPQRDRWIGELEFVDCRGGMRTERWQGRRRLAVLERPWPAGVRETF